MSHAAGWSAVQADGVTPSTALVVVDEHSVVGSGPDGVSARITAAESAVGHALRRTVAATDISSFTELRLSFRANRRAGPGGHPMFLELRLGSEALPVNAWHRLLPVRSPNTWETVRLSIDDLPAAVAGAVTRIQLRCVDAPFTAYVDDLIAVRPLMLADADQVLVDALSGISVAGQPVAVAVRAAGQPTPDPPAVDILQFDVRPAPGRALDTRVLRDFSADGARTAELGAAYDLDYAVTPVAATRAAQAELLEGVLRRLAPLDELVADGDQFPVELVGLPGTDRIGGTVDRTPVLVYRVGVRGPMTVSAPLHQVTEIHVDADQLETA